MRDTELAYAAWPRIDEAFETLTTRRYVDSGYRSASIDGDRWAGDVRKLSPREREIAAAFFHAGVEYGMGYMTNAVAASLGKALSVIFRASRSDAVMLVWNTIRSKLPRQVLSRDCASGLRLEHWEECAHD